MMTKVMMIIRVNNIDINYIYNTIDNTNDSDSNYNNNNNNDTTHNGDSKNNFFK